MPIHRLRLARRLTLAVVVACCGSASAAPAKAPDKVSVQLKWYHQFQFAGYYAAAIKGFYREEGLEVELVEGAPERPPEKMVLEGRAQFAIHDGGDLIYQRLRGKPLVALAAVFQHSPYVLLSQKSSEIRHPSDLVGRTVLISQSQGDAPVLAMFLREGVKVKTPFDVEPVRFAAHTWNFDDLIAGRADAMSAYITEVPGIARLFGFTPATLNPLDYGIDFYGDTLFTRADYLRSKPDVVARFRRASLRGWAYALANAANAGEIADHILTLPTGRQTPLDRQALRDEARMLNELIVPTLVEIGNMNPGRWQQMAKHYEQLGMVDANASLDGFVYAADAEKDRIRRDLRVLAMTLAAISIVVVACLVWLRLLRSQVRMRTRELTDEIAERKLAQEECKLAASVFTHAREGITITSNDGTIIDVNAAFTRITGYSRDEAIGQNPRLLKSNHHDAAFYATMWDDLVDKGYWHGEIWNRRKSGELYPEILTISAVRDENGRNEHYVALFSDITPMKAHEQQLEHMAHFDMLTTLPNRVLLADRLHQAMAQQQRRLQRLAVAYLDLDGFKQINDEHGHAVGDKLLIAVASQMKRVLREGDTLARLGGDEFVAVLLDIDNVASCVPLLARLLDAASEPVHVDGLVLKVSASVGVTLFPQADEVDADQLLRQADQAMYQAKLAGKNRYHVFDADHDRSLRGHHESLAHMRVALRAQQFVLHYQPKVNMRSGEVIGVEALIRWQHPERGLLPPGAFLPVIDAQPLAIDIGEWVIDAALQQIEQWHDEGLHLPVSVNVGARHLQQRDFTSRLQARLDRHPGVRPGDLEIEVLETSALEDVAQVSQLIAACQRMGVAFSLDDFGTGYSSLTYLKRLAVDTIKIDQSFVRDMPADPESRVILEGIVSLAVAFRRQVIAEGVETVEHGAMLLDIGSELAQGYGIARPMPAAAVADWVASWRPDAAWVAAPRRAAAPALREAGHVLADKHGISSPRKHLRAHHHA